MIVHRPEATEPQREAYRETAQKLSPVILELSRKTQPLLEHEVSATFSGNRTYGTVFHAEKTASPDFRYFSRKIRRKKILHWRWHCELTSRRP